ncbi:Lrp/AsnC family transcriptional regulator [Poriferisphaera sp. WC338]|uniref:Lrp/AsnC family transcriptional regulator n=1 Tax=Poriferisphaera sp. WC338 TaxID=3425129 RepID=UPI003D8142EF
MSTDMQTPTGIDDPINAQILAISEDKIQGFVKNPIAAIAEQSGISTDIVIARIRAMLQAGTIRRVRQTLMATNLAPGALVAWKVPADNLNAAFDYMFENDPFSGHAVLRSTDKETPGSEYKLWTTLKVPIGYDMSKHCDYLASRTGAEDYILLPAKKVFSLGVGHMRRRKLNPGDRTDEPGRVHNVTVTTLSDLEWKVLIALKREFEPDELNENIWGPRAKEAGVSLDEFCTIAEDLNERRVIGRFSTFLEHVKKHADGKAVTRYNALYHWAVPSGKELEAGIEVGRHHCMTHAYWREGGPQFNNVNVMGVSHGTDKDTVLAHKAAIDEHLKEAGIDITYTNVFWGGRSEIKPSEISPIAYLDWCAKNNIDPESMKMSY